MKKKIALLLSVAMLTASLAGCGGKSGSTSAPAGDSGSATTEQEALRQAVTKTPWLSVPMLTSTIWISSSSRIRSTTLF